MEVKIEFIQVISTVSLQKEFPTQNFLNQFSISNENQTKIKILIMKAFQELENSKLVENELKLIQKNGSSIEIGIKEMYLFLLTKNRYISFFEK